MKIKVTAEKANQALAKLKQRGSVSFDGENGRFSVSGVEGRFAYDSENETLTVLIDDTPLLVSEDYCYSEIKKYFS